MTQDTQIVAAATPAADAEFIPATPKRKKKGGLFRTFGTDKKSEVEGILVRYDDIRFMIARAGGSNQKYKTVFAHESKPHRRQIDNESLSEEVSEELMRRVYAKAVILDWGTLIRDEDGNPVLDEKGNETWTHTVEDEEGNALTFSEDNVVHILRLLPDLFTDIRQQAMKQANFRAAEEEADKGN